MERDVQQTKKMPIAKEGVRTITPFENGVIMLIIYIYPINLEHSHRKALLKENIGKDFTILTVCPIMKSGEGCLAN